ncbi:MAG TPA: VOC family protein [Acidimicrobiales bacterium]|jgi:predicted enzyme related to lactoylglutathione lyase|nr:VOC family protein [Acidimicrobiales bacterium]
MSTRVSKLANVIVPVADQDRALAFYTDVVGLEIRADVPFGDGNRWIEVAPAGADTVIALAPPGPTAITGGEETGISLQTDDVDAYYAQLKSLGADVDPEISRFGDAVPPMFWFRDPEGNRLLVAEVR